MTASAGQSLDLRVLKRTLPSGYLGPTEDFWKWADFSVMLLNQLLVAKNRAVVEIFLTTFQLRIEKSI